MVDQYPGEESPLPLLSSFQELLEDIPILQSEAQFHVDDIIKNYSDVFVNYMDGIKQAMDSLSEEVNYFHYLELFDFGDHVLDNVLQYMIDEGDSEQLVAEMEYNQERLQECRDKLFSFRDLMIEATKFARQEQRDKEEVDIQSQVTELNNQITVGKSKLRTPSSWFRKDGESQGTIRGFIKRHFKK